MRAKEAEAYASMARGRRIGGTGPGPVLVQRLARRLMEAAVERSNMVCAYDGVVKN